MVTQSLVVVGIIRSINYNGLFFNNYCLLCKMKRKTVISIPDPYLPHKRHRRRKRRRRAPLRDGFLMHEVGDDDDDDDDNTPPPAKRRKLSSDIDDNEGDILSLKGPIFHPQYVPRSLRDPDHARRQRRPAMRRLIIEEDDREHQRNGDEDGVVDEEDELDGEIPGLLTDDEEEDEEDKELNRLREIECVGCRMIHGLEEGTEHARIHIIDKLNVLMAIAKKTKNMYNVSKYVEVEFHDHITSKVNLIRRIKGVKEIPRWTDESIRKHYKDNHCDNEDVTLYNQIKNMHAVADALQKYELIYYDHSGVPEIDPVSGKKRPSVVKRCRLVVARALFSMRKEIVNIHVRVRKEQVMQAIRVAKMNGGQFQRRFSMFEDVGVARDSLSRRSQSRRFADK